jgi:hypothetical protein
MFVMILIVSSLLLRPLSWKLCRGVFYPLRSHWMAAFGLFSWGFFLAIGLRLLIIQYQPHWAVKYFLGYGIGTYAAFINFGLFNEATIPPEAQVRHLIVEVVPVTTFIITSIAAAWLIHQ